MDVRLIVDFTNCGYAKHGVLSGCPDAMGTKIDPIKAKSLRFLPASADSDNLQLTKNCTEFYALIINSLIPEFNYTFKTLRVQRD